MLTPPVRSENVVCTAHSNIPMACIIAYWYPWTHGLLGSLQIFLSPFALRPVLPRIQKNGCIMRRHPPTFRTKDASKHDRSLDGGWLIKICSKCVCRLHSDSDITMAGISNEDASTWIDKYLFPLSMAPWLTKCHGISGLTKFCV